MRYEIGGLVVSVRREDDRRHGLSWLYRISAGDDGPDRPCVRGQVLVGGKHCHVRVRLDPGDRDVGAAVAVPGLALWATLELPYRAAVTEWLFGGKRRSDDRVVSLSVHHAALWWKLWTPDSSWSEKTPRWRDGNVHPIDVLLGQTKYTSRPIETREVVIPMPERVYRWRVALSEDTWQRPRWPWRSGGRRRAHADCLDGEQIPIPGKGENAWDCDEDAMHGCSMTAASVDDAVVQIVASATRTRLRYGGADWRPEAKPAAAAATAG